MDMLFENQFNFNFLFDQLPLPGVSEPISVSSARILLQDRDREKPDDIGFDHNKQMLRLFLYFSSLAYQL